MQIESNVRYATFFPVIRCGYQQNYKELNGMTQQQQYSILFSIDRKMSLKENQSEDATQTRRYRNRRHIHLAAQGNNFVLKRYRLEENQQFKDKTNEDLDYHVVGNKFRTSEQPPEVEEDLVIIPLEVPSPEQSELEQLPEPKLLGDPQEVYVFDDEDESKEGKESAIKNELPNQLPAQVEEDHTSKTRHSSLKIKKPDVNIEEFKRAERSNFSTAELMTPSAQPSTYRLPQFSTNEALTSTLDRKKTVKFAEEEDENEQKIKGVELLVGQDDESSIKIVDKRLFAISRLPSGIILRCLIKRSNSFMNLISPEYDLYLANGLKHILSTKKYPMRNRELFKFSTDPVKFSDQHLLSVMHANSTHNVYWMLDLPKRVGELDLSFVQLVVGYYRLKESTQHRKFSVLLPTVNSQYQLAIDFEQSFINFSNFKEEIKVQLMNLQKWRNQNLNSTKNFVLADEGDEEYRYLQMRKESDNVFELTIQYPFSPLQAMAVAMTRFDAELK